MPNFDTILSSVLKYTILVLILICWNKLRGFSKKRKSIPETNNLHEAVEEIDQDTPYELDDELDQSTENSHAVFIEIPLKFAEYGTDREREQIFKIENELEAALTKDHIGILDGNSFGDGVCTIYLYGNNADTIFAAIEPILLSSNLNSTLKVIKRYGSHSTADENESILEA